MSRNVIRVKKNWCEKHFSTLFLVAKRGGGLSKMSADCQQGGRKLPNLASADIWMTPYSITISHLIKSHYISPGTDTTAGAVDQSGLHRHAGEVCTYLAP